MMEDADPKPTSPRRKITEADLRRVNLGKAYWPSKTDVIQQQEVRDLVFRYRRNIPKMISVGSGVFFSGEEGVGKTSAAACILKEAIAAGQSCYFASHPELRDIRFDRKDIPLFGNGTDGVTVRRKIETTTVLVIDGINDPFFDDKVFGPLQLEELLTKRFSDQLVTVMTTRSSLFKKPEHSSLLGAVKQCMVSVPMAGRNMKLDAQKNMANSLSRDD